MNLSSSRRFALALLLSGASTDALVAQTPPATAAQAAPRARVAQPAAQTDPDADEEIVVTGQRPRGAVVGDVQPEITLSPADIRGYGASSISDLLDALSPQTGSARGRGNGPPVVLLDGHRISGFAEIRDLPTEAIARAEILPEEVALKYGYTADQRVVNIVLRQFFRSKIVEAGGGLATEGGGENGSGDLNLLRIQNSRRLSFDAKYNESAWLTESDRDVISRTSGQLYSYGGNVTGVNAPLALGGGRTATSAAIPLAAQNGGRPALADFASTANAPSISDTADARTLRPRSRQATVNAVYARPIGKISASVNARYDWTRTLSLQGPPLPIITIPNGTRSTVLVPAGNGFSPFGQDVSVYRYLESDPLRQRVTTGSAHGGLTLNGDFAPYRWSVTGNFDRVDTRTRTDRGFDETAYQARITANDATLNPFARLATSALGAKLTDSARSVSNRGEIDALLGGPIATLPAGQINSTLRFGGTATGFSADSLRLGVAQSTDLSRQTGNAQLNIDLPIASRRKNVLPFLGELSVNGNASVEQVSGFGTLTSYGYGLNWTPITKLRILASATHDENAPSVQQLGNPIITTAGVRVFDYRQGTTVDVVQVSGGNPALTSDNRQLYKLSAQFKPFTQRDLTFRADFVSQRIRNQTANLPAATLEIEAAFPDRFTRDVNGVLNRVDSRAVNFAREDRQTLRLGIDLSIPLKPSAALLERQREAFRQQFERRRAEAAARGETLPPFPFAGPGANGPAQGQRQGQGQNQTGQAPPPGGAPPAPPEGGPPPGGGFGGPPGGGPPGGGPPGGGFGPPGGGFGPPGGGFGGPGGGGGRGGGANQAGGRIQLALYDNWTLKDRILIRPGVPVLDLLGGASVGSGGGTARHQIQAQLGYNNSGLGARLEGNYNTGTRVNAGAGSTTGDLRFATLTTVNFRLFANLQQLPSLIGKDWARGARVTLSVNNLFNERQKVRDTLGNTPLSYQPAYLDALGRNVKITFRKLFFSIPRRPPQQPPRGG